MSNDKIIPFGKYKGQEIEQVIARDPQYVQWIMQQAWFQEKFQPIYQVVINQFAPSSEDTPAHNALQVRFLEHDFRCAFWLAAAVKLDWSHLQLVYERNIAHLITAPQACAARADRRKTDWEQTWRQNAIKEHRARVKARWSTWRRARGIPQRRTAVFEPKFEMNTCDVQFCVETYVGWPELDFANLNGSQANRMMIEIKPSMGDDYPAVLRQIKRQKAMPQPEDNYWIKHHWLLLVDEFASNTVTLDQVRKIFALDDIKVLLVADLREQLIKIRRASNG